MISHDSPLMLYWEGPNSSKQQGCLISQNSYRDLQHIFFFKFRRHNNKDKCQKTETLTIYLTFSQVTLFYYQVLEKNTELNTGFPGYRKEKQRTKKHFLQVRSFFHYPSLLDQNSSIVFPFLQLPTTFFISMIHK